MAARTHKDLRYRERCFPGAEDEVFHPTRGFVPLPIVTRRVLKHLKDPQLRVWIYLLTRASRFQLCYPTVDDILQKTGIRSRVTFLRAIRALERAELIKTYNDAGARRYLLRDPRLAAKRLYELGDISEDELQETNDLLENLKLPAIEIKPRVGKPVQRGGLKKEVMTR